jgi:putative phosphoribosyl transferase
MFADRQEAGRILATQLKQFRGQPDVIVLGLTRGGVPVAFEVARSLQVPLDVIVVRKLGAPGQPELALGAIAPEGVRVLNPEVVAYHALSSDMIAMAEQVERQELERREAIYRQGRPYPELHGKRVILVDDGLATGATMRAAIEWTKLRGAGGIIVAAPVASREACDLIMTEEKPLLLCHHTTPEPFWAVGVWYRDFPQVSDDEVLRYLSLVQRPQPYAPAESAHPS